MTFEELTTFCREKEIKPGDFIKYTIVGEVVEMRGPDAAGIVFKDTKGQLYYPIQIFREVSLVTNIEKIKSPIRVGDFVTRRGTRSKRESLPKGQVLEIHHDVAFLFWKDWLGDGNGNHSCVHVSQLTKVTNG